MREQNVMSRNISRGLWIVGWFAGLLIFNITSHWSQNIDKNGLFVFLEALDRLTSPAELLLSAVVVYGIASSGQSSDDGDLRTTKKKAVLHTALILVGTLVGVVVIGLVAASLHGEGAAKSRQGQAGAQGEVSKSDARAKPLATLPTLAHLKAQMKEDNPGMSPREFKQMRAATGFSHIWELHKDSFKPVSALYLADGTVCYQYSFVVDGTRNVEYGVLTTDGLLYANALGTGSWKQYCAGERGEEMAEAAP
jgi:hypothetical protein